MTASEWNACVDPTPMLEYMRSKVSERKLRLFACACYRRVRLRMKKTMVPEQLEVSERFADGEASKEELTATKSQLGARGGYSAAWAANNALHAVLEIEAEVAAKRAISYTADFRYYLTIEENRPARTNNADAAVAASNAEHRELAAIVRELFGSPFCPIAIDPPCLAWNDGCVLKLAQTIYDDRAFDHLPLLADALEDAGCIDAAILSHCRQQGEHVRGCWVVDLLLGKS